MLNPWTITIRRSSGEADYILTRAESSGSRKSTGGEETLLGDHLTDGAIFQRPKANSSSCITDGIKSSQFLKVIGAFTQSRRASSNEASPGSSTRRNSGNKDTLQLRRRSSILKGSVDSLINKFRSSHRQVRDISMFIVVPHGPLFEILSSEKVDKSKKKRHSRSTCNSPHRDGDEVELESLEQRLNNINFSEKLSLPSDLCSNELDPDGGYMDNLEKLDNIFKFKNYSTVNDQLPKDFLKNYSDKSFSCPLQDISISSGKFKARLPLTAFPCGHVCLKVRGFRLEIIHLLKHNQFNNDNNNKFNNNEPVCLNSILNDFTYKNSFSNFCKNLRHPQKDDCNNEVENRRLTSFTTSHNKVAQHNDNRNIDAHITAQEHTRNFAIFECDRVSAYNYLGSVSFPIFVEPCSLQFDVVGEWLVFSADTKLSIGMEDCGDNAMRNNYQTN